MSASPKNLRPYNLIAGVLHLAQAVAFGIALTKLPSQVLFPVTADYMAGPPGTTIPPERVVLANLNLGIGVVLFLALSAFFHFVISSGGFYRRYLAGLSQGHNYFRWFEYSLSSSVMIWLIAQLTGISDVAALLAIFGVNASMILFGAVQEKYEQPRGGLVPFYFGCIAGIVPWLAVGIYLMQPGSMNEAKAPGFVIGIFVSLFIFFNTFALNQWLQYKAVGKWRSYLYGERMYITLSLIAKSALAWQVFSGAIVPVLTS